MDEFKDLKVVPLHSCLQLKQQCCELLNEEWKRSTTARLHSIEKSSGRELPLSLILVGHTEAEIDIQVFGHSRLCRIASDSSACWIESVVVSVKYRSHGLGRRMMEDSEKYAKSLGFTTMYLSTHDKQSFYEHLGYKLCPPKDIIHGNFSVHQSFLRPQNKIEVRQGSLIQQKVNSHISSKSFDPAPPPLPSVSLSKEHKNCRNPICNKCKVWMKKVL